MGPHDVAATLLGFFAALPAPFLPHAAAQVCDVCIPSVRFLPSSPLQLHYSLAAKSCCRLELGNAFVFPQVDGIQLESRRHQSHAHLHQICRSCISFLASHLHQWPLSARVWAVESDPAS